MKPTACATEVLKEPELESMISTGEVVNVLPRTPPAPYQAHTRQ